MIFRPGLPMRKCGKTLRRVESTELFTVSYGYYFDEPVWNWGCQLDICSEIILNDPRKIHRCSDKIVTAEMLADYFPKTWTEYSRDIPVPFIAKRNFTMMGRGKRIVRSHAERLPIRRRRELGIRCRRFRPQRFDLFQEFLPKKHEYRIIVCRYGDNKKVVRNWEKVRPENDSRIRPDWAFTNIKETPSEIVDMLFDAIERLDLNIVGFDVIITDDDIPYIIEANSAPGTNEKTAQRVYRWARSVGLAE